MWIDTQDCYSARPICREKGDIYFKTFIEPRRTILRYGIYLSSIDTFISLNLLCVLSQSRRRNHVAIQILLRDAILRLDSSAGDEEPFVVRAIDLRGR